LSLEKSFSVNEFLFGVEVGSFVTGVGSTLSMGRLPLSLLPPSVPLSSVRGKNVGAFVGLFDFFR